MKQLNEKVAIVTGAGQGIGKGIAMCLAKRGVKVVCTGRREAPIQQTVAEIEELGGQGLAMTCDSADRARRNYCKQHTGQIYGDSRNYDLTLCTSALGLDKAEQILLCAVKDM